MPDKLDAAGLLEHELASISTPADFCKDWKTKWRGTAIAAQGILKIFFPAGAKVLGNLIAIADTFCALPH
ncbi:MAG TPA: hypothetical protein VGS22_08730 [Thermoanaerobaculia bacterium]|nr:hypothetical protein [Thermoanaerobaculia bacterium]